MADHRVLATDGVVVLDGEVLMIERDHDPQAGSWVLPGGMVDPNERAREACVREVREEVGLDVDAASFVGLFDSPDRDERGNVSAAFLCVPAESGQSPEKREEARRLETFDSDDLPENVGFDHAEIVRAATAASTTR